MKFALIAIAAAVVILGAWFLIPGRDVEPVQTYESAALGISFSYSGRYMLLEQDQSTGARTLHVVVLMEDTEENRALVGGESSDGREGPPTITIAIHQNNLDNYTTERFIRDTNFSNFKLSDGKLVPFTAGSEEGLRYHASGLYENENVVFARPDFVYLFTVNYLTPEQEIVRDFERVLQTVEFANPLRTPTSADEAPAGSIHNLPLPPAVAAVRAHAAAAFGVGEGLVIIETAFERQWPDACLGLPSAEEMCAQVITSGWEVTLEAAGEHATFRTNSDGSVIRRFIVEE